MIDPQVKEYGEIALKVFLAIVGFGVTVGAILKFVFGQYRFKDLELKKANREIINLKDNYREGRLENMQSQIAGFGEEVKSLKNTFRETNTSLAVHDDQMTRVVRGTERLTSELADHSKHVIETFAQGQIKQAAIEKDIGELEEKFGEAQMAFKLAEKTYRDIRENQRQGPIELDKARKTLLRAASILTQAKQEYDRLKVEVKGSKLVKIGPNNYIFKPVGPAPASQPPKPIDKKPK